MATLDFASRWDTLAASCSALAAGAAIENRLQKGTIDTCLGSVGSCFTCESEAIARLDTEVLDGLVEAKNLEPNLLRTGAGVLYGLSRSPAGGFGWAETQMGC